MGDICERFWADGGVSAVSALSIQSRKMEGICDSSERC